MGVGTDRVSTGPPDYAIEGSVLYAPQILSSQTPALEQNWDQIERIEIRAGSWRTVKHLQTWFHQGV